MAEFIKQSWVFPVVQSFHIMGIAMLVGTICLLDLRLLRRQQVEPWTSAGLLTVLLTGPILFGADLTRYVANPAFVVKMVLLAVALASHFAVHRNANPSRAAAMFSLGLWCAVVLAGRAIADFDIFHA